MYMDYYVPEHFTSFVIVSGDDRRLDLFGCYFWRALVFETACYGAYARTNMSSVDANRAVS